jgi:glyoxylase-like metal-dependent hydrolase (beta-lactamase superfamily II)
VDTRQFNLWLNLLDKVVSPFIKYCYEPIEFREDDVIVDTDDVDISSLTGICGSIVHTPGHSRGSISLVLKNGNSFVGDVAMNTLRVFGQQYRPIEAESYGDVYRSWARLIEKGARDVYPSHGSGFLVEKLTKTRGISKQARIDCFPKDERIPCGKGGI